MQVDPQIATVIEHIAETVFNLGFLPVRAGEEVVAHGHGGLSVRIDAVVLPTDIGPALDGKAAVFRALLADEVRQRLVEGLAELILRCERRLEHHISLPVSVERVDVLGGTGFVVAAIRVNL